jgi:hypothetical protein
MGEYNLPRRILQHMQLLTGKLPYADMLDVGGSIMDWGLFLAVGGLYGTNELYITTDQLLHA